MLLLFKILLYHQKFSVMGWIKEFKEFAVKGNLIDVAVAFVMGAAFGKVVSSFTEGLVAPLVSLLTGGADLSQKEIVLRAANEAEGIAAVTLKWGAFATAIIDFLIVAFVMFLVIKAINKLKKAQEATQPSGPSSTDQLLMEIRDSLKK
jgi:large conductance mechanosensitive channel